MKRSAEFDQRLINAAHGIMNWCQILCKFNRHDAEDLFQTVMLKALLHPVDDSNINNWLMTIARNHFINEFNRSKTYQVIPSGLGIDFETRSQYQENTIDTDHLMGMLDGMWIGSCLKMYSAGYKYKEISSELNIPIDTVKSRIYYARERLMKEMDG